MKIQIKPFAMHKQLVFTVIIAMFLSMVVSAQTNKEEIDLYQSIFGMAKKEAVAGFLQLEQNDPFWALYDQYESERKVLGQKRIAILNDYAENYSKLTDEKQMTW